MCQGTQQPGWWDKFVLSCSDNQHSTLGMCLSLSWTVYVTDWICNTSEISHRKCNTSIIFGRIYITRIFSGKITAKKSQTLHIFYQLILPTKSRKFICKWEKCTQNSSCNQHFLIMIVTTCLPNICRPVTNKSAGVWFQKKVWVKQKQDLSKEKCSQRACSTYSLYTADKILLICRGSA